MKLLPFSSSASILFFLTLKNGSHAFTPLKQHNHHHQSIEGKETLSSSLSAQRNNNNDGGNANNAAKKAALEGVMQKIERSYGRGSIVKLGDADNMNVDCISSGALTLGAFLFSIVSFSQYKIFFNGLLM